MDTGSERSGPLRVNLFGGLLSLGYFMLAFLVPLDALHLHYSVVTIGLVTGLPSLLQLALQVVSGPLSDRYGERRMLVACSAAAAFAGLCLGSGSGALWVLLTAQLANNLSRGLYWVPAQSYVSRLAGEQTRRLGVFASINQAGSLSGVLLAGPLAGLAGYAGAFDVCAGLQLVSLLLAWALRPLPRTARRRTVLAAVQGFPALLRGPVMRFCCAANFLAAIPQALVQSFYPVALVQLGLAAGAVSAVSALRSAGVVVAGFVIARLYARHGARRIAAFTSAGLGMALAATAIPRAGAAAAAILGAGLASGLLTILATIVAVERSAPDERGSHLAITNVGFTASLFVTPLVFGFGSARGGIGLGATFATVGALTALGGVALAVALPLNGRRSAASGGHGGETVSTRPGALGRGCFGDTDGGSPADYDL